MPSTSTILLIEANQEIAQSIVQLAKRCFNDAVWHVVSSVAEAVQSVETNRHYNLVMVDYAVLAVDQALTTIGTFARTTKLLYTPVLLVDDVYNSSRAAWAYATGFSAYHTKPSTSAGWNKLLQAIHLYWFTINQVPSPLSQR